MKKIISFALAVLMIVTISTTAFATDIKNDSEDKSGTTDITYTVSDSYIVTIPDSMTIGTDATVSVSNVVLGANDELSVTVASTNGWKLKNGDVFVPYTAKVGNDTLTNGATVLTAKNGDTPNATITTAVDESNKPQYAGSYTDTLTFRVACFTMQTSSIGFVTALANGGKYKLGTAMQSTPPMDTVENSVELDLNGNNLTITTFRGLTVNAKLVLNNSNADAANPIFNFTPRFLYLNGELVINAVTFQCYNISINKGGKLTINGGIIDLQREPDGANRNNFIVTGGTFKFDPTDFVDADNYNIVTNEDGTYTVTPKV